MDLTSREYGAGPEEPRALLGRDAALLLLTATPPANALASGPVVAGDLFLDAEMLARTAREPGPPAPLLPPVPRRNAEALREALEVCGIATRVVPAASWSRLVLRAPTAPGALGEARKTALELLLRGGLYEGERSAFEAVLREAIANAALHGNRGDESKLVTLDLTLDGPALRLRVADEGSGFDTAATLRDLRNPERDAVARTEARFAEGLRGGLGLLLLARWADRLAWEDGGRSVVIEKTLPG